MKLVVELFDAFPISTREWLPVGYFLTSP